MWMMRGTRRRWWHWGIDVGPSKIHIIKSSYVSNFHLSYKIHIQVVPGRAGGGSFRRKKTYIAKKEFAYRMCASRPTSAMPKPFLCCERAFCCSMVVMCRGGDLTCFDVMRSVAGWDEAIKVLLQYYSVLQSTTPVLLCTAKCYSSTTLYCKVLLQYYSVLQSAIPVLLCTTKYYSSTTLYYTVLQRTTPVLLCTTKYYSVLQSTTPVLLCTTKYYSSTTLYYKVLLQYYSVLHSTTTCYSSTTLYYKAAFMIDVRRIWNVSFTTRGATGVILQRHEILHLPRKITVMIDPRHIWNVIYNEQRNRNHNPSSPNTAPATQNECHHWSASHMTRHFQCAEQVQSPFRTSPNTAPATQNESHDWSASHMKRHLECAEQQESPSTFTKYCACHAKWISWLIRVTYETSFPMRGAIKVNLEPHQILRLPRKMNLMIDPCLIWNVISNAQSKQSQPPTSANTAPATQNESHD